MTRPTAADDCEAEATRRAKETEALAQWERDAREQQAALKRAVMEEMGGSSR